MVKCIRLLSHFITCRRLTALLYLGVVLCTFLSPGVAAQSGPFNAQTFFDEQSVLNIDFVTDIKKLRSSRFKPQWLPATLTMHFSEVDSLKSDITIRMRGHMRKDICDIAALELNFTGTANTNLSKLKTIKLVGGCRSNSFDEELLVKEYLIYKMYNQLTPLSFKVRMLKVHYRDSRNKVSPYTQMAFVLEDTDVLAKRNGYKQKKYGVFKTESTNRMHTTFVSIFQYMIANTDWSVTGRHNIKLLVPVSDTTQPPFIVPYDFDYSGLVNAPYAVPNETLGIANVRVRLYRGYPRTDGEIKDAVQPFKTTEDKVRDVIKNCNLLQNQTRKDMLSYLHDFYEILERESSMRRVFIQNARVD